MPARKLSRVVLLLDRPFGPAWVGNLELGLNLMSAF